MFNDPASVLMGLRMMRRGGGPVYLLRDEFTTDASAPLASPRTCEPGPGTLDAVQTYGQFSISGGKLVCPASDNNFHLTLFSSAIARAAGLCAIFQINISTNNYGSFGFLNSKTAFATDDVRMDVKGYTSDTTGLDQPFGTATDYRYIPILRTIGAFHVRETGGVYTLLWVQAEGTTASMYAGYVSYKSVLTCDYWRVAQLGSPWTDDYGIATNRVASASAGETTASEANALVEATWTAATGETWELDVRRTDADNRWIVRCDQAGSTIKLIERNGGSETERSSASQTWTAGSSYRLVVISDTQTITTHVANVAKNTYTSASFNQTATGVKTSHAVANLIAWPRTLSGAALAELQRYTA